MFQPSIGSKTDFLICSELIHDFEFVNVKCSWNFLWHQFCTGCSKLYNSNSSRLIWKRSLIQSIKFHGWQFSSVCASMTVHRPLLHHIQCNSTQPCIFPHLFIHVQSIPISTNHIQLILYSFNYKLWLKTMILTFPHRTWRYSHRVCTQMHYLTAITGSSIRNDFVEDVSYSRRGSMSPGCVSSTPRTRILDLSSKPFAARKKKDAHKLCRSIYGISSRSFESTSLAFVPSHDFSRLPRFLIAPKERIAKLLWTDQIRVEFLSFS